LHELRLAYKKFWQGGKDCTYWSKMPLLVAMLCMLRAVSEKSLQVAAAAAVAAADASIFPVLPVVLADLASVGLSRLTQHVQTTCATPVPLLLPSTSQALHLVGMAQLCRMAPCRFAFAQPSIPWCCLSLPLPLLLLLACSPTVQGATALTAKAKVNAGRMLHVALKEEGRRNDT
jgi:hypothetical protein